MFHLWGCFLFLVFLLCRKLDVMILILGPGRGIKFQAITPVS